MYATLGERDTAGFLQESHEYLSRRAQVWSSHSKYEANNRQRHAGLSIYRTFFCQTLDALPPLLALPIEMTGSRWRRQYLQDSPQNFAVRYSQRSAVMGFSWAALPKLSVLFTLQIFVETNQTIIVERPEPQTCTSTFPLDYTVTTSPGARLLPTTSDVLSTLITLALLGIAICKYKHTSSCSATYRCL